MKHKVMNDRIAEPFRLPPRKPDIDILSCHRYPSPSRRDELKTSNLPAGLHGTERIEPSRFAEGTR
jgi:hypothetical protein